MVRRIPVSHLASLAPAASAAARCSKRFATDPMIRRQGAGREDGGRALGVLRAPALSLRMRLFCLLASIGLVCGTALSATAHQLLVLASTDCEVVLVEARFSTGRAPSRGEVRILNADNTLLLTLALDADGTARFPLADVDASTGFVIEVEAGNHDDYWILTPEDIARQCPN